MSVNQGVCKCEQRLACVCREREREGTQLVHIKVHFKVLSPRPKQRRFLAGAACSHVDVLTANNHHQAREQTAFSETASIKTFNFISQFQLLCAQSLLSWEHVGYERQREGGWGGGRERERKREGGRKSN